MLTIPVRFDIVTPAFAQFLVADAPIRTLKTGMIWCEGPAYLPHEDVIVWSDIPNNIVWGWRDGGDAFPFLKPSNYANGHTVDPEGRLISCEHGARRVTRLEKNGRFTVIADRHDGKRLNSPNDVVVRRHDGSIWFTDPPYGIMSDHEGFAAPSEQSGNFVYRWDPQTGHLSIACDDFEKPNGLCFSPDESLLYISDTSASHDPKGRHHVRKFHVGDDGTLRGGEIFITMTPGLADGFRTDSEGNIWCSAGDGIHCYDPRGQLLGKILTPERTSNCCFAGKNYDKLVITATDSVYLVPLRRMGIK